MKTNTPVDAPKPTHSPYETTELHIDSSALNFLQKVLVNLYETPWKAVLREYASNALDSHIRVGQTSRPVEITLPRLGSSWVPNLIVQDFGSGMTKLELQDVYSSIGTSTKRDDNEEVGGFGLGCKSALAVVERFDIDTVKNGIRTLAFIKKNESGLGVLHIVSEDPTTDENGTTITIPTPDYPANELIGYVDEEFFIGYTEEELTITNYVGRLKDTHPVRRAVNDESNFLVGEDVPGEPVIWIERFDNAKNNEDHDPLALIGGVVYPINRSALSEEARRNYSALSMERQVYINVPVGSVQLPPTRETLQYDNKTIKTLTTVLQDARDLVLDVLQEEYDSIPTAAEALQVVNYDRVNNLNAFYNTDSLTWRGKAVPRHLPFTDLKKWASITRDKKTYAPQSLPDKGMTVSHWLHEGIFIIEGVDGSSPTLNRVKCAIGDYIESKGYRPRGTVLVTTEKVDSIWFDSDKVVTVEDFNAQVKEFRAEKRRLNANVISTPKVKVETFFWVIEPATDKMVAHAVKRPVSELQGEDLIYLSGEGKGNWERVVTGLTSRYGASVNASNSLYKMVRSAHPDKTLIWVDGNRMGKFLENFPDAVQAEEGLREHADELFAEYSKKGAVRRAYVDMLKSDYKIRNSIERWKAIHELLTTKEIIDQVKDAELVEILELTSNNTLKEDSQAQAILDVAKKWASPHSQKQADTSREAARLISVLARYPFINDAGTWSKKCPETPEVVLGYLNLH